MKKMFLILFLCLASLTLAACGGQTDKTQAGTAAQETAVPAETEPSSGAESGAEAAPLGEVALQEEEPQAGEDRPVDLDLTKISGTVVYSQVYDMMMNPDSYMGQKIKLKGNFSYFQDPDTKKEYFAAVIADATACCAQGIEFVWKGAHSYPQDYPPLETEITITGYFHTYFEGEYMYVELIDADVAWSGA